MIDALLFALGVTAFASFVAAMIFALLGAELPIGAERWRDREDRDS